MEYKELEEHTRYLITARLGVPITTEILLEVSGGLMVVIYLPGGHVELTLILSVQELLEGKDLNGVSYTFSSTAYLYAFLKVKEKLSFEELYKALILRRL